MAAGICAGSTLTAGALAAYLAAFGQLAPAVDLATLALVLVVACHLARLTERVDHLDAPGRRCDWCDQLYRDPIEHTARCEARHPQPKEQP